MQENTKNVVVTVKVHKKLNKAEVENIFEIPGVTFEVKRRTIYATTEVSSYSEKVTVIAKIEDYVFENMDNLWLEKCRQDLLNQEMFWLKNKEKEEKEKTRENEMIEMEEIKKAVAKETDEKVIEVLTLGKTLTISKDKERIKTLQIVTYEDLKNSSFKEKDELTDRITPNSPMYGAGRKFISIISYPKETLINEELTCVRERVNYEVGGCTRKNLEIVFMIEREYRITSPITKKSYILTDNKSRVKNKNIDEYLPSKCTSKNETKMIGDFYIVKGKNRIELVEIITYHNIISKIGEDSLLYNRFKKEALDLGILPDKRGMMVESHIHDLLNYREEIFISMLEEQDSLNFKEYTENNRRVISNSDNLTSDNVKAKVFFIARELRKYDDKEGEILFRRFEDF